MLLITQSRVVNEHRVNVGPQQVSAVGHCQRLSANYGRGRFLALRKEGSESELGNVNFLKLFEPTPTRVKRVKSRYHNVATGW